MTIAAAPGQTPVLTSLFVGETNKWMFNGLKVQSLQSAALSGSALVQVKDAGATLPTSDIVFEPLPIGDPARRRPDISRARALLGWEPEVELRDGLARMRDWYLEERDRGRA